MSIAMECPHCGARFKAQAQLAGKRGRCPNPECRQKIRVPEASAFLAEPPEPVVSAAAPPVAAMPVSRAPEVQAVPDIQTTSTVRRTFHPKVLLASAATVGLLLLGTVIVASGGLSDDTPQGSHTEVALVAKPAALKKPEQPAGPSYAKAVAPFMKKYCAECHQGEKAQAGLAIPADATFQQVQDERSKWESIMDMLEFEAMPPEDKPQPTAAERKAVIEWIESRLFFVSCDLETDPGRVTIRRLNRNEYNYTIRDLLGVDFRPADEFPSDDVGYGFDNIGDVLTLSPLLFEKYLDAAETVAEKAIVTAPKNGNTQHKERKELRASNGVRLDGYGVYGLSSSGNVQGDFSFPRKGKYLLRCQAHAQQAGDEPAKMQFSLDGKDINTFDVKAESGDAQVYEIEVEVEKGKHRLAAAFINDYYNPQAKDPRQRDRNLYIHFLEVVGPVDLEPKKLPASHRRLITVTPGKNKTPEQAAREILRPLMKRAFRRPVRSEEVERMVGLVQLAMKKGESFERGIQVALTGVLVSPHFLFRIELHSDPDNPKAKEELNSYEMASRLSYFLWSSMPDDELLRLADQDKLRDPKVLEQQALRMLRDPKAEALVQHFGGQWLNLGILEEVEPDPKQFPMFNAKLRRDMRKETELFFGEIMREDRSILAFLDGEFTYLNERLAEHYGIPRVKGEHFRRVSLSEFPRAGVLTQASILTLTSNPTRTSPVQRGKWILENILGTPPPEAPANVPELEETQKAAPNASLREQLELHRKDPNCATCHRQMDALGFGFENFDPVGRWREKDGKFPIDSSGELPGGDTFNGPRELVKLLANRKAQFTSALAEKLLTYALGRGVERQDKCVLEEINQQLAEQDYRFSLLVTAIVTSEPFRMKRGEGDTK